VAVSPGLWGNGRPTLKGKPNPNYTWKTFEPLLRQQGYDTIVSVDYTAENDHSFDDEAIQKNLGDTVNAVLNDLGKKGIVAGKLDIVAHSMGGLVTRFFCQNKETKDICRDSVRKFITIDTPHFGSELADLLLIYRDQNKKFPNPYSNLISCHTRVNAFIKGHPIHRGGVDALAVGKVPDRILEGAELPKIGAWQGLPWPSSPTTVYSIFGRATEYQDRDIKKLWNRVLSPCGFKRDSVFSGEGGDDGIVGANSQIGEIGGQDFDEDHFSVLGEEKVVEKIKELLDKKE